MCRTIPKGDDEPFISAASVITEACSHRHNHLLECLEIGSAKKKRKKESDSGQVAFGTRQFVSVLLKEISFPCPFFCLLGEGLPFDVHWGEHLQCMFDCALQLLGKVQTHP